MKNTFILFLTLLTHHLLLGQAGTLDLNFGTDGIVKREVSANSEQGLQAVIELPDGSTVAVGGVRPGDVNSLITRHAADGSVMWDVEYDASRQNLRDFSEAVTIINNQIYMISFFDDQSQGFQTVSGSVSRWNLDGTNDTTFGDDGEVVLSGESTFGLGFFDLQKDSQDRLYLIGRTLSTTPNEESALVIRMNADGVVDQNYGSNGMYTKQWNNTRTGVIRGKVIGEDLYLAGWYNNAARTDLNAYLSKVSSTGTTDNSFGTGGRVTFTQSNNAEYWSIDQQGENHLLVTGSYGDNDEDIIIRRYDFDGDLDQTFANNGTRILDFNGDEDVKALIVDGDGFYIGAKVNEPEDFGLIRLLEDGDLDMEFGDNGLASFDLGNDESLSEMVLLSDGNIILVGEGANDQEILLMKVIGVNGCTNSITDLVIEACESYEYNNITYTNSGQYQFTFDNNGCDSIVNLDLTINTGVTTVIDLSGCDSVFFNGNWIYNSVMTTDVVTGSNGCDSTINLMITVNKIDALVEVDENTLSSTTNATSYQWIDCDTNLPIPGATSNSYTPDASGAFALAVSDGTCVDTSECIALIHTSIDEFENLGLKVYPNPVSDFMILENPKNVQFENIQILNTQGILVKTIQPNLNNRIEVATLSNGYYFMKVETKDGVQGIQPFVKL